MDLIESKNKQNTARHPWEYARFKVTSALFQKFFKSEPNHIWDVGCGDTFFVESLLQFYKNAQYAAIDIEFTEELIEEYSQKFTSNNVRLFKNVNEVPNDFSANLVLLMDVIEHIEDDVEFMKMMKNLPNISSETAFFITVPAYQSLFCSHDEFLLHYRRYTNKMLKKHLNEAGFEVAEMGYFFSSLILPRIVQVLKEKLMGVNKKSTGLVEWNGSEAKTQFITNTLFTDFKVSQLLRKLGLKLPGLSNYALCYPKTV